MMRMIFLKARLSQENREIIGEEMIAVEIMVKVKIKTNGSRRILRKKLNLRLQQLLFMLRYSYQRTQYRRLN